MIKGAGRIIDEAVIDKATTNLSPARLEANNLIIVLAKVLI